MITNYFENLAESVVIISLFCILYIAVFQQETSFRQNRLFLLIGILFSLFMPYANFSYPQNLPNVAIIELDSINILANKASNSVQMQSHSFSNILFTIYAIISGLFVIRLIIQLIKIGSFAGRARTETNNSFTIIYTNKKHAPFSFLKFIFIDKDTAQSEHLQLVIQHETIHISQKHSIDLLLFEMLRITQWFNPLVWIYGKKIKENHEFLVDNTLINNGIETIKYQQILLTTHSFFQYDLTNNFSNSLTFKRLVMMTKSKTNRKSIIKLVAILPILIASVYLVSCSQEPAKESNLDSLKNKQLIVDKGKAKILPKDEKVVGAKKSGKQINGEDIYSIADEMPEFEGGDIGLRNYIAKNVKYPDEAKNKGIEGKVYVMFVVGSDGNIASTKVVKGVDKILDDEAVRVVKSLPKWQPGKVNGVAVPVYYTIPISFKLQ